MDQRCGFPCHLLALDHEIEYFISSAVRLFGRVQWHYLPHPLLLRVAVD